MINKVGTVCIFVNDQDAAKAFYTEKLGMEVHMDGPLGDWTTNRWISTWSSPKSRRWTIRFFISSMRMPASVRFSGT